MLHTIRQVINNDEKFREILRGLNRDFYHQTVTGKQVEDYMSQKAGMDLSKIFDQYLRTVKIPKLEYRQDGKTLQYRWTNVIPGFDMPIRTKDGTALKPTEQWQKVKLKSKAPVQWDENFYVDFARG